MNVKGCVTRDVVFEVEVELGRESIMVRYLSQTVSASWATRALHLLGKCVNEILTRPDTSLFDLDILPAGESEEIQMWNRTDLGHYESCLHQVVHERVLETPNDLAVCAWDGELTYRELDILSSHVAWILHSVGVDTGAKVAFLFGKSKWTVVSVLGIVKAGAAAVALNHDYPIERSKHILKFTEAAVLLIGRDFKEVLGTWNLTPETSIVNVTVDEELFPDIPSLSDDRSSFVSGTVKPCDVAYIQFTSGSTGQPKGIMIEHRTYLANAISQHDDCCIKKDSRVLHFASHSFDAFLTEVFTPLLVGACVCIPSEESRFNDLAGAMREFRVTWMGATPTLTRVISPKDVPDLQTLCTWGEPIPIDVIESWADAVELINNYGPSENSVGATTHSLSKGVRDPMIMGKGMKALNTWIVRIDNREKLAPIGAIGELVLQGPTVARGYLHDPVRSAASFKDEVPWLPPASKDTSQRIYYTGDLFRYTQEGVLVFWGRSDTQVKIRGHRIELGEIEYHINQFDAKSIVSSIVEVVRPFYRPEQKMLIAFICEGRDAGASTPSLLRPASDMSRKKAIALEKHLAKYLTSHSVPSLYLPLQYMPTLASGKTDRLRLRKMIESLPESELLDYSFHSTSSDRALATETEILMASLWAEILGIDVQNISLDDNFFWLGGNSILAMRLAVAARKQGLLVSVAQILNNPQLQRLTSIVLRRDETATQQGHEQFPSYAPFSSLAGVFADEFMRITVAPHLGVEVSEIEDIALATDYQIENLAWSSLKTRGGTNYITFDFEVGVDESQLHKAIERSIQHHAILRTVYFAYRRRVYQVALKQSPIYIVYCSHTTDVEKETSVLMAADSHVPLDISQALAKFYLLSNGKGQTKRLVFRASHLQYDGVTLIRWCKELGLALSGSELLPTASFFGYMNFAANNNEKDARQFWRTLLAGSTMTNVCEHASIPWKHVLNGEVTRIVNTASLRSTSDITIGTTIKSAWALVLAEMAGTRDVVFGSVIGGRNAMFTGVEHVAGACIDNIPARVRLDPDMTRLELLQQVQGQYFEAVSFENFQYKRIVQECTEWRPWERLSTLVEYENLEEADSRFNRGQKHEFTVNEIRPPADRHDVTIFSMPIGKEQTFIALDFCKAVIPESTAQRMLDRMVEHLEEFHNNLNGLVALADFNESRLPHIPFPLDPANSSNADSDLNFSQLSKDSVDETSKFTARKLVEEAWIIVLASQKEDLDIYWTKQVPFYEVWGNLIASHALARHYTKEGFTMSMEDVLENSSMQSQAALLLSRGKT
jgi:amino acid adenylation domain-containing protein